MTVKTSLVLLGTSALPVLGETILGLTVFSRHGDRNSKHYSGYGLTNLGFQQNFQVGEFYRDLYIAGDSSKKILGISEDQYINSQVWASAPDQKILANTATAFLQGLYPPLTELDPEIVTNTINNGTEYSNPLNGYQYIPLHAPDSESPNAIWIKGDDECPAITEASESFEVSTQFLETEAATKNFYQGFWEQLQDVYDYTQDKLSYAHAYDIFDLINVAQIHNSSASENVTAEELFQLRTLADSAEFGLNFNASMPARAIHAQTLSGAIYKQLNQTVSGKGKLKFSLFAGSYDTFLAFFGLHELIKVSPNFYGLPDYASTMAFEILTDNDVEEFPSNTDDLKVRFLFRNGSNAGAPLTPFPLFGQEELTLSWAEFSTQMLERAITKVEDWCNVCASKEDFCAPYDPSIVAGNTDSENATTANNSSSLSSAAASAIGAGVTLGVILACGGLFFLLRRKRIAAAARPTSTFSAAEKGSISS